METQCLRKRRIPTILSLNSELDAWHTNRNINQKNVFWQFTNDKARIKLKQLYPIVIF
jgi:hypothetical protein